MAAANINFCAGYDVAGRPAADSRLASHDLRTNAAHLLMLVEQAIVPPALGVAVARALLQLRQRFDDGEELLRPACEDIHMSIEAAVTEIAGPEAGGRLHTGRSRNDQIATDMRLWLRAEVAAFAAPMAGLAHQIGDHATRHLRTICPGFTHGQPAMVTSWGHWTMSYMPRLLRDIRQLGGLLRELTTCPLGAAASYGTSWPVNRTRTAQLLGFKHPTPSGADGIWCRGELESRFAFILAQYLAHLSGIGQDIILLSSPPRDWLRLADEHITGSSIMPQKRNPDFAEVTRSRASVAAGIAQGLLGIGKDLPSGYNRDTQWTKYLAFDAADNARHAGELYTAVFSRMAVNVSSMADACDVGFLNATDVADFLSRQRQLPFRQCYKVLGGAVKDCEAHGRLTRDTLNHRLEQEAIAPLTEQEWLALERPDLLLLSRRQPGNPHPDETAASIELLRHEIDEQAGAIAAIEAGWASTDTELWAQLTELARG